MPVKTSRPLRVLIAGAGVAGLEAILALRSLAEERVRIELLAPESSFAYRPLAVAEPFSAGQVQSFDLGMIASATGAHLHRGALTSVDPDRRVVRTSHGPPLLIYDVLLVASGARPREVLPGAITFRGSQDVHLVRRLLQDCREGQVKTLVFAVPDGASWPLPLYELALLTAAHLTGHGVEVELTLVTPEAEPLELFGRQAVAEIGALLEKRGIRLLAATHASSIEGDSLRLVPGGSVRADRVVTLPRLRGPGVSGIPQTSEGFIPTDLFGRVEGLDDVFAAGDATDFPIKQGGIAAQQADVAAETIAMLAGAPIQPAPFQPVLRGVLLTGAVPRYLSATSVGDHGETSVVAVEPLWWPPAKIVGRYLSPFLAAHSGLAISHTPPVGPGVIPVEVDLASRPRPA